VLELDDLKNLAVLLKGHVEPSYNPTAKFPQAFIERKDVTYSYEDGDLYHFMDNVTPLRNSPAEIIGIPPLV